MWVDRLRGADDNSLNTDEREGSVHESGDEAKESASGACDPVVVNPWAWVSPVAEASCFVVGTAASGDDNRYKNKSNEAEHFDGSSNDLCFTKDTDGHQIDRQYKDESNTDDYRRRDITPIADYHSRCRGLGCDGYSVAVPVRDSKRESHRRVNKPCRPMWEGSGRGELCKTQLRITVWN